MLTQHSTIMMADVLQNLRTRAVYVGTSSAEDEKHRKSRLNTQWSVILTQVMTFLWRSHKKDHHHVRINHNLHVRVHPP